MNIQSYLFGPLIVLLSLLAIADVVYITFSTKETPLPTMNSFEDCVKAGLPILETYPEQCKTPDGRIFTKTTAEPEVPLVNTHSEILHSPSLVVPLANTLVRSPLNISGSAPGPWYFEASFPVILKDANGNILAQTTAKALGDWMSTDTVPFSATLTWSTTTATSGMIILKKDNPSGLPEHDAELHVQLLFEK